MQDLFIFWLPKNGLGRDEFKGLMAIGGAGQA